MGGPDQFAKRLFAEETAALTADAISWLPPPEISLTHVHGDGALAVHRPDLLSSLPSPWRDAAAQDETLVELKVNEDNTDTRAVERVLLRRQARQVELVEKALREKCPLPRQEGLWVVAPRVPRWLRDSFDLTRIDQGCYRVGPCWFQFLWLAANEMPLRDELVPFLVVRSGLARDEFVLWVAERRPWDWVSVMLQYIRVKPMTEEEFRRRFAPKEDPEDEARRLHVVRLMLDIVPSVKQELIEEGVEKGIEQGIEKGIEQGIEKGIEQGIEKGRLAEARAALRRVLARRGLVLDAEQDARIEACKDTATLERWLDQAITAASGDEALR